MLLAERHPDAGSSPAAGDPRRADYLQWMFNLANMVAAVPPVVVPGEPAGETQADARSALRAAHRGAVAADRRAPRRRRSSGDAPTVADFYLVMLMRWSRNMPRPATEWPQLAALAARLKVRPSFTMLYAREGLTRVGLTAASGGCPQPDRDPRMSQPIAADPNARLPRQIPIIGNEACERFSFYGMRNIRCSSWSAA